jgi:hypothetical protein
MGVLAKNFIRPRMGLDWTCTILLSWNLIIYLGINSQPPGFNQYKRINIEELTNTLIKRYPFDQFPIAIHQARFIRRSVGSLDGPPKCALRLAPVDEVSYPEIAGSLVRTQGRASPAPAS